MNAKERWVTILGLAGTFLLPWPGEADHYGDPTRDRSAASACARVCAQFVEAKRVEDDDRSRIHVVPSVRAAEVRAGR
jgi:hypothetical protein